MVRINLYEELLKLEKTAALEAMLNECRQTMCDLQSKRRAIEFELYSRNLSASVQATQVSDTSAVTRVSVASLDLCHAAQQARTETISIDEHNANVDASQAHEDKK